MSETGSVQLPPPRCKVKNCTRKPTRQLTHDDGQCPFQLCECHSYYILNYNLETNRMKLLTFCKFCQQEVDPVRYEMVNLPEEVLANVH